MPVLDELLVALDGWYDPRWAEPWDAVGLVCGDRNEPVERVLLAVDAVPGTVAEAVDFGAQLLVTHHPLLLTPVHGVPADDPKGALVHRMIRSGLAHLVAHTNADVADPGVSDALGARLGLQAMRPLQARSEPALDKLVTFVPVAEAPRLIDALAAAGAGALGDYDRCAWTTEGTGTFRPLAGANPAIGSIGQVEQVAESRVEMVVPVARRAAVIAALRATHPYEEPAFDLLASAPVPSPLGTGRVGELAETTTLAEFVRRAAAVLPATAWGLRAAGDPQRAVRRVAVCGGSGGSLTEFARAAGADVLLTADLKHHPVVEAVTERGGGGMALVDAAHWATEAPWLARGGRSSARSLRHYGGGPSVRAGNRPVDTAHAVTGNESNKHVNADPAAQLRLLDLQAADTAIAQLAHKRATLPELAALAERSERATQLHNDAIDAETELADIVAEQRKLEHEVETVRARAERDEQRLQAGGLPAKELEGLQHEVVTLARRQSTLEDELLEVMERHEESEARVSELERARAELTAEIEQLTSARDTALGRIDADSAAQSQQRAAIAVELPADLLAVYERARDHGGGVGAAALRQRRCEGCHIELSGAELTAVRSAEPDEVVRCEECRRILVRTAESGL